MPLQLRTDPVGLGFGLLSLCLTLGLLAAGPTAYAQHFWQLTLSNSFLNTVWWSCTLHWWSAGRGRSRLGLGLLGLLGEVALLPLRLQRFQPWGCLLMIGSALGWTSALGLAGQALAAPGPQRRPRLALLARATALPLLYSACVFFLNQAAASSSKVYDLYLYAADEAYGGQLAFVICDLAQSVRAFGMSALIVYYQLGTFMAIALWRSTVRGLRPFDPLLLFALLGLLGSLFYQAMPAVGPAEAFAPGFPHAAPPAQPPVLIDWRPGPPRNSMPSLHMSWALAVFWACLGEARWLRWLTGLNAVGMSVVAFIGSHYLVDLVVALPFAGGLTMLVSGQRWRLAAFNLAVFLAAFFFLRDGSAVWFGHPGWIWLLTAVCLACGAWTTRAQDALHRASADENR